MAQIAQDELDRLTNALQTHDHLRRTVAEIERLHRVVFHGNERADWSLVGRSAAQILIAEIVHRHRGDVQGVFFALRSLEDSGKTWDEAVQTLASTIHSYYTTPLGVVMRYELFGADAVFFTPDAYEWTRQQRATPRRRKRKA